jgi:hypothetical protein
MNSKANRIETSDVANNTATDASTPPQDATEAAPPAAADTDLEQPASDADSQQTTGGAASSRTKKPARGKKQDKKTEQDRARHSAGPRTDAGGPASRERLLAPLTAPTLTLDRVLLPDGLLGPLDAAALGTTAILPSAAFITLAVVAAVAGPRLTFAECADPRLSEKLGFGTSLRIAVVGEPSGTPMVPGAIMAAAYDVENDCVAIHQQSADRVASLQRTTAERRRLHDQASRNAFAAGH